MGLTGEQKTALASSWKTLSADAKTMQANGATLFGMLFKAFPDSREYFPHLKGTPDDGLNATGVGRAHAISVFSGLGAFIACCDDQETMDGLATKLSRNHLDRKIGPARFQQMRQIFGGFLDKTLGGGATADVKGAWDAFLGWLQEFLASEEKKR